MMIGLEEEMGTTLPWDNNLRWLVGDGSRVVHMSPKFTIPSPTLTILSELLETINTDWLEYNLIFKKNSVWS